jgi:hypothetical protein
MNGMEHLKRPLRAVSAIAVVAMLAMALGTSGGAGHVGAQEASPVATQELPRTREQVIAQGLAIFDIEPAIWRVVEIEPPIFAEAEEFTGDVSFAFGREGATIIRNNVTLKRARIEPGEAYFFSAEDPYVRYSIRGAPSRIWAIEYVAVDAPDDEAGGEVIFKSDPIERFQPGTRDLELIRNTLLPGDVAPLPSHRDPALLLGTGGTVTVSAGDASSSLGLADGMLLPGDAVLSNTTDQVATYIVVVTGARVPDPGDEPEEEQAAEATETPADNESDGTPEADATEAPTATATPEPSDTDGDGLTDDRETELQTDPANPDTDGDGTSDGDEVFLYGTDPNDPESTP